VEPMLLNSLFF